MKKNIYLDSLARFHIQISRSDNLFKKRREERKKRVENIKKQKSSNWLIVCEGTETEPNYFKGAIEEINKNLSADYKLKVTIVGKG